MANRRPGVQLDGPGVSGDGAVQDARFRPGISQLTVGLVTGRLQANRCLKRSDGVVQPAFLPQDYAPVDVSQRQAWAQFNGLGILCQRSVLIPLAKPGIAEVN